IRGEHTSAKNVSPSAFPFSKTIATFRTLAFRNPNRMNPIPSAIIGRRNSCQLSNVGSDGNRWALTPQEHLLKFELQQSAGCSLLKTKPCGRGGERPAKFRSRTREASAGRSRWDSKSVRG